MVPSSTPIAGAPFPAAGVLGAAVLFRVVDRATAGVQRPQVPGVRGGSGGDEVRRQKNELLTRRSHHRCRLVHVFVTAGTAWQAAEGNVSLSLAECNRGGMCFFSSMSSPRGWRHLGMTRVLHDGQNETRSRAATAGRRCPCLRAVIVHVCISCMTVIAHYRRVDPCQTVWVS